MRDGEAERYCCHWQATGHCGGLEDCGGLRRTQTGGLPGAYVRMPFKLTGGKPTRTQMCPGSLEMTPNTSSLQKNVDDGEDVTYKGRACEHLPTVDKSHWTIFQAPQILQDLLYPILVRS